MWEWIPDHVFGDMRRVGSEIIFDCHPKVAIAREPPSAKYTASAKIQEIAFREIPHVPKYDRRLRLIALPLPQTRNG